MRKDEEGERRFSTVVSAEKRSGFSYLTFLLLYGDVLPETASQLCFVDIKTG